VSRFHTSRGRLFLATGFEAAIAFAAVLSALVFLAAPDVLRQSPVGRVLHPWDYVWSVGYGLAGLTILFGLFTLKPQWEIAGLALFAGAIFVNLVAVVSLGGWRGFTTDVLLVGFIAASVARIWVLFHPIPMLRLIEGVPVILHSEE
jgi:hypothetical protein